MLAVLGLPGGLGALSEDRVLEVAEGDQHDRHVVQRPPQERVLQNVLHSHPALLVDVGGLLGLALLVVSDAVPHALHRVLVAQLVEDPVAPQHNEIVLIRNYPEALYFRRRDHHILVAAETLQLGFSVPEGPRHGKAPWQHPQRPHYQLLARWSPIRHCLHVRGGPMIYLTTSFHDSFALQLIIGLVVSAQRKYFLPFFCGHEGPGVAYVGHIAHVAHDEGDDRAGS
mmetsp:Transcript_7324/g.6537  ORF Transcript_7324/g.6537 Transcript_7324/m.6537 type:complete len:227 (-) Transcript_7324:691-1371(-)